MESHKFKKCFGQNFISDINYLESLVSLTKLENNSEILEIGAGMGTLTKVLSDRFKKVISYEIDKTLTELLVNKFNNSNVQIVIKDALKENIEEIEKNFDNKYSVIANIPYYITTPLIFKFLGREKVDSICLMVQNEVGDRIIAKVGDSEYSALSVMVAYFGKAEKLKFVSRNMFYPAPNVDSCFIKIENINNRSEREIEEFSKIVKCAFQNRRKSLVNNIVGFYKKTKVEICEILLKCGIDVNIRGEKLDVNNFIKLAKELKD